MSSSAVSPTTSGQQLAKDIEAVLGVDHGRAEAIVQAFEDFVASPLEANLRKLSGRALAKRNPMIYTARGVTTVAEWVSRVLDDKETSAIEGHVGTWQEEVARIVSGGIKPGSGVDLQLERAEAVELYAIQSAPNTKSAGGRRSDVDGLRKAASVLRASRRQVELYIAVLSGRSKSAPLRADPNITVLASDEFWARISGRSDFRRQLIEATAMLSVLLRVRAASEVERIRVEATQLFGDSTGNLNLDALANPPRSRRMPASKAP